MERTCEDTRRQHRGAVYAPKSEECLEHIVESTALLKIKDVQPISNRVYLVYPMKWPVTV